MFGKDVHSGRLFVREVPPEMAAARADIRDGDEVIAKARELQPDVITLDLSMRGRGGLDALPELVQAAPAAKTIVVSAYSAPTVANEAMRRGAVGYIEKGTTMVAELLLLIASACSLAAGSG